MAVTIPLNPASSASSAANVPVTFVFGHYVIGASNLNSGVEKDDVCNYETLTGVVITKLRIYLEPGSLGKEGEQKRRAVIYADNAGKPQALLATSEERVSHWSEPAGWYDFNFAAPVALAQGTYWIGESVGPALTAVATRWDNVAASHNYNSHAYSEGPRNPFGSPTVDEKRMSVYAVYTPAAVIGVQAAVSTSAGHALPYLCPTPVLPASSTSSAANAVTAATQVALAAAGSSSSSTLALNAPTRIVLAAGSSASEASATVTAPLTVVLVAGSSVSAASLSVTAPTLIPLAGGSSTSAGVATVIAPTRLALSAGSSSSAGTLAVSAATLVPLAAAGSQSSGTAALSVITQIPLAAAVGASAGTLAVSAPTRIALAGASSSSSAQDVLLVAPWSGPPLTAGGAGVLPGFAAGGGPAGVNVGSGGAAPILVGR